MRVNLTKDFVATAQTDMAQQDIRDVKMPGLELRVTRKGIKTFAVRYRRKSDGRKMNVLVGRFPEISVEEARKRALRIKANTSDGADPAGDLHDRKQAMTFRELAEMRLASDTTLGDGSKRNYKQHFDADVFAAIGDIPANEVTADMVARILDRIEERGATVHADRTKAAIGSTFKWAIKRRRAGLTVNPTAGLGKRSEGTARKRVLDSDELARFWRAVSAEEAPLTAPMRLVVKLAALTGQRREEVCGARQRELRLDGPAPTWTIPGDVKRVGKTIRAGRRTRASSPYR